MNSENVLFKLNRIHTEQFSAISDLKIEAEIRISAAIDFGLEKETKKLLCTVGVNFYSLEQNFINLKLLCEFSIAEESWKNCYKPEQKKFVFPANFMQHLGIITVGTARGVLHAETKGTDYNRLFLPTVNLKEMVPGDVSFPAEEV